MKINTGNHLILLVGILVAILLFVLVVDHPHRHQTTFENIEETGSTSTDDQKISIVEIADPFSESGSVGATFYANDPSLSGFSTLTNYVINQSNLILPYDFSNVGTQFTQFDDNRPIVITQHMTFVSDCVVTWEQKTMAETKGRWDDHPDHLNIKSGQSLSIDYTSKDGGKSWLATVKQV